MRVEQMMSPARCCSEDDTVRAVARMMRDENVGFAPICDGEGKPVGALTDRDLAVRILAEGRSADEKASDCMTRDVMACRIGDDLKDAIRLMREQRKSRVMVCDDDGRLKGVISLQDIAEIESEEETGETLQQVKSDQPAAH